MATIRVIMSLDFLPSTNGTSDCAADRDMGRALTLKTHAKLEGLSGRNQVVENNSDECQHSQSNTYANRLKKFDDSSDRIGDLKESHNLINPVNHENQTGQCKRDETTRGAILLLHHPPERLIHCEVGTNPSLFSKEKAHGEAPSQLNNATLLAHQTPKKGSTIDKQNYRPVALVVNSRTLPQWNEKRPQVSAYGPNYHSITQ